MDSGKLLPQSVNEPVKIFLQDTDVSHRKQFISQVYTTLWFQLVYTSIFVGLCNKYEPLSQFMKSHISYTIYSVLSIVNQTVPPTNNLINPDKGTLGFDLVPITAKKRNVSNVLSNSFGFGGTNASLIIGSSD